MHISTMAQMKKNNVSWVSQHVANSMWSMNDYILNYVLVNVGLIHYRNTNQSCNPMIFT